ncbi:efflux RND transporter periplasmic adaptor subunit [Rhizobium sp. VS19-DR104.2]|uniref:efflux RND transporter periplasmic adaptor subunit n=1 Tax=unclassified Rhizobium TaxID=2613769 RepID=UPI001CC3C833|nr:MULTISPECIES: efflux RND transporter periplasmic adaptor subunit [unclassified Rhizobium]MBZ5762615.1 efflux RND transporter periplasmic adaptor subunit [Rhizobium sp. VS19-DR96]MBZ5768093.1 efflux RND transporter periplasmic adaptor subunit [Rhizobium sp. VS19-DR129.2]MBZ5775537.1 efflux RND transporter periplasmic adaptor subunit [Rhizobium sp. VS19-DRK62.2]MBZ5787345.1 efflux RND transporter periplasmic adaptor subunit [Rhizobium sp. VS19-DR121]MBZ5804019.1 efflux RND transporter peripla
MKSVFSIALLASVAAVLCSCDKQQSSEAKPKLVETVVASTAPIAASNSITGEIDARVQSDLSFRVSGQITERLVDVGSAVKAGQVLARIDPAEQKADLAVAKATLESAQAVETQAQLAYQRQLNLFKTQVTTKASLDQAQETLLTAQGTTKSDQASLETAQDALSYTELRADSDGVITARNAEVGQVAQAASAVFTLAHDGPRDAVFNVYESLFLKNKPVDKVTITLLSDPTRHVEASIREISPTIDSTTGTIKVKVGLENAPTMPLGAPVAGTFRSQAEPMIELPWSAMASKAGHTAVWVVDPASSKVSIRPVDVSTYGTGKFGVIKGVAPGDIIVVDGTKFLRPDQLVSYGKGAAQ